jgi:hypothetical protein
MSQPPDGDEWTAAIVQDPAFRKQELRRAGLVQNVFSLLAAGLAIVAVWGYTAGSVMIGGIGAATIGGLATLSFAATMVIAAGGGIRRRVIFLVLELLNAGGRSSDHSSGHTTAGAVRTPSRRGQSGRTTR